ncbi:hypothetical protein BDZ89DRAFT_1158178 [Hymenopellis radicata]|nr:hypothetical protein BDZ89DRAFT_1158178 [Hymenopellis radicata]
MTAARLDDTYGHTAYMAFPQELFDCILENVVDRHTLANWALVNHTLGRRCQELLFRKVSLRPVYNKKQFQAFVQLLVDSPHIRLFIRELSIYNLSVTQQQPTFDRGIGFVISSVVNLTHILLQFEVPCCVHRKDLPDFLTTTVRPALRQLRHLYSVTFSDGDGCLTQNVVHLFRACDGLTAGKIVVKDCDGIFCAKPSVADNLLSFPNVTEIEFLARGLDASFLHPWLSYPSKIFPRLRIMTIGVSDSWGVKDMHLNLLPPQGLPGLRCFKTVWHAFIPDYLRKPSEPNSAAEEIMPMLAIGTFPEVILEYRVDVYNDIAVLWWCRVFGHLEMSVIENLKLVVYTTGGDLTSLEPWAKLDGILSSWRFRSLKEFTVQFWVTPFEGPGERQTGGRVELPRLEFPEVSRKVKTRIFIDSSLVPEFWFDSPC